MARETRKAAEESVRSGGVRDEYRVVDSLSLLVNVLRLEYEAGESGGVTRPGAAFFLWIPGNKKPSSPFIWRRTFKEIQKLTTYGSIRYISIDGSGVNVWRRISGISSSTKGGWRKWNTSGGIENYTEE